MSFKELIRCVTSTIGIYGRIAGVMVARIQPLNLCGKTFYSRFASEGYNEYDQKAAKYGSFSY
jgi:hypothetical protein